MRIARPMLALLVTLTPVLAFAQQAVQPTREDVLKLFTAMRVRETMQEVRNAAVEQARRSLRDMISDELPGATPQQIAELDGMVERIIAAYTIDNTIEDLIPIYQKHLSRADLEAVTAFFSSAAGRKFLDTEPVIAAEAVQVVNAKTQEKIGAGMAAIYKRLDEMKAERAKALPKPAATKPGAKKKTITKKPAPPKP